MAPPPSQQGKFRPKKQRAKKKIIKPGASSTSDLTPTPSVAFAPAPYGGRGSEGRARAQGVRERSPIPQGRVFFTGVEKKTSPPTNKKQSAEETTETRSGANATEEIVGQLDIAVGIEKSIKAVRSRKRDVNKGRILDSLDFEEQKTESIRPSQRKGSIDLAFGGIMYDSDSSQEELDEVDTQTLPQSKLPPLQLPIAKSNNPTSYQTPEAVVSETFVPSLDEERNEVGASPFLDQHKNADASQAKDSWFLVQLPTRLPPLKQNEEDISNSQDVETNHPDDMPSSSENTNSKISEVSTPPLLTNKFDNVLSKAPPGRIGKVLVYKSGKTVLVMEDSNGQNKVLFNVTEGLTCGFLQQAVTIDSEDRKYVELGNVNKSIVVSPILDSAFTD